MATAADLSFELVQRTWDCFGIPDPALIGGDDACGQDETERGIKWEDYKRGASIIVRHWKTGKLLTVPLVDNLDDGKPVPSTLNWKTSWRPPARQNPKG